MKNHLTLKKYESEKYTQNSEELENQQFQLTFQPCTLSKPPIPHKTGKLQRKVVESLKISRTMNRAKQLRESRQRQSSLGFGLHNRIAMNQQQYCNTQTKNYESICNIMQQENENLKKQNEFLLEKLKNSKKNQQLYKTLYNRCIPYKRLYLQVQQELQMIRSKCEAYKTKAEQLKNITLTDIQKLKAKLLPRTNDNSQTNASLSIGFSDDQEGINEFCRCIIQQN